MTHAPGRFSMDGVDGPGTPDDDRLERLTVEHAPALAAAYERNREHLARWDPARAPEFYTAEGQAAEIEARVRQVELGLGEAWLLVRGAEVIGRINLANLVRGSFQSCSLGYWVDGAHTRRGLATALVEHAVRRGLALGLHRLEAGTVPANTASQAVLRRCGFEELGRAPAYLFVAGEWRDHVLFQRILHDRPPGQRS